MIDSGVQASDRQSITLPIVKKWFVEVSPAKRRFVLVFLPAFVFGIIFSVMIPAQADTASAPGSGDATNLEIGPTMGSVEVDDVGEVPFIAIVVALAASVWLLVSSLGPRGLQILTAIDGRRR
jgi:hypothetical protein